ncbi:MAG: type VI secretion system baseplate subunit TssG [Pyrinomonadaceae bacterium]
MVAQSGREDTPLAQVLLDEPYRFDFFQAVRLLERIYPERASVGREGNPLQEVIRFRSLAKLGFPPSELYDIKRAGGTQARPEPGASPLEMFIAFMGLTGPQGVLPTHYTELLMERARYKDTAMWEFFDLFTHRMVSLFYRAWEKHRFPVAYERGEHDRFTEYLFNLIGMGTGGLRGERAGVPDQALVFYGGLVLQQPHSASAVESILSDYFGAPARMEQFTGQWLKLEAQDWTRIGAANNHLGISTVAGTRVWDTQSKFRMKFGPLTLKQFTAFLPTGSAYGPATKLLRYLVGTEFDFDIQLTLKAKEVPSAILTTRARRKPMLGWTTWLKTRPFDEDDSQVVLAVNN